MKNNKGFTLIELIVTIAIISILSGIAIISITSISTNAKKKLMVATANEVLTTIKSDYIINNYNNPQIYNLTQINGLLSKKLNVSPFKKNYSNNSCVTIYNNNNYSMCLTDENNSIYVPYAKNKMSISNYSDNTCECFNIDNCFIFNSSTSRINGYKCYAGNAYNLPTITDVIIPPQIGGYNATIISGNVFLNKNITSLTISEGITTIGTSSFQSTSLNNKTIIIPSTITAISSTAFYTSTGSVKNIINKSSRSFNWLSVLGSNCTDYYAVTSQAQIDENHHTSNDYFTTGTVTCNGNIVPITSN